MRHQPLLKFNWISILTVCGIQPEIPENLSSNCPLWDENWREEATRSKMSVGELNRLRSRALVPGVATAEWIGYSNVSHLPVMLVQNPGASREDNYLGKIFGWLFYYLSSYLNIEVNRPDIIFILLFCNFYCTVFELSKSLP